MNAAATEPKPKLGSLPRQFTVDVTVEDIRWGTACDCHRCPLAIAIERTLRLEFGLIAQQVSVLPDNVEILMVGDLVAVPYWHSARSWVLNFDHYGSVEPCTVSLVQMPRRAMVGGSEAA